MDEPKPMAPHEYSAAVAAHDRYRTPAAPHGDADHACTGLGAELVELLDACDSGDPEAIASECGDVLWYATNAYHALVRWTQPPMPQWPDDEGSGANATQSTRQRVIRAACSIIRHQQYHGHRAKLVSPLDVMRDLHELAKALRELSGVPLGTLARRNIDKLNARRDAGQSRRPMYVIAPKDATAPATHLVPGLDDRANAIETEWQGRANVGAARALWDAANDRWYVELWPSRRAPDDARNDATGCYDVTGPAPERPDDATENTLKQFVRGLHDIDEIAAAQETIVRDRAASVTTAD